MSLINQVLHNVEARQGQWSLATDGHPVWQGAPVKPVLGEETTERHWRLGRAGLKLGGLALLLCGLAWWLPSALPTSSQWRPALSWLTRQAPSSVSADAHSQGRKPAAKTVLVAPALVATEQPSVAPPLFTRQLFSPWQGAAATPAPSARRPAASVSAATASGLVTQHEGEFSIQSPVLGSASMPAEQSVKYDDSNSVGVVNKQLRPDQEVNVLIQRAVDHEQKGRPAEAMALLRQALERTPHAEEARQLLAAYLFENKQDAEAVALLQAGVQQFPTQVGVARSLARWQLAHAQAEQVIQTLKPLALALTQDAEAQWMLAMAYQQTGQHAAAVPHFEQATLLRPAAAPWLVAYALSLQANGQPAQALQQLEQAQALPLSERMQAFVSQRIRQLSGS